MTRETLDAALKELQSEFTMDELFEKLDFIARVNEAREQIKSGATVTHDDVKTRMAEWQR